MSEYEILILDNNARPSAFVEMQESNDARAVYSASRIAGDRTFEVWRGLTCIHRHSASDHTSDAA